MSRIKIMNKKEQSEHLQKVFNAIIGVLHGWFGSDTCQSKKGKGLWHESLDGDHRYCSKLTWGNPIVIPNMKMLKSLQSALGSPLYMMYHLEKWPNKKGVTKYVLKYDG